MTATTTPQADVDLPARRAPSGERGRRAAAHEGGYLRGALSGVLVVVLATIVAAALAVAVVPRLLGGAGLTVLSGSMEPTYSAGDVVVPVPQDRYGLGDVVTFQPVPGDPVLVTHRIVAVGGTVEGPLYTTRGDANGADDAPITSEQIMGRVLYSVPWVGNVTSAAGPHRQLIVTIAAVALIGYGAYSFTSGVLDRRRATPRKDES